ncbi:hypothetical protein SAMN04488032_101271 [Pacificibacter marinus]|uniref:Anti-sigma factor NepR domain-containing protein n=1 Tax=Pacificibacter marinus TaxID=658057 RepID=A0A1Y5RGK9_9RHOB|nr:hypothetical protein SAMN04488032_101271 [Pacificibacter marinus]SLN16757.1 hypothetical protein PAM7971_00379 [Pacificibacter marinus]
MRVRFISSSGEDIERYGDDTGMNIDNQPEKRRTDLIKDHLRRSFQDKAAEELPSDLMSLIGKLREQDDQNGK